MFASLAALAMMMGQQIVIPFGPPPRHYVTPRAPIEQAGPQWAAACKDWDEWNKPAPAVRVHANTFNVGTCGISVILITGSDGDILIDSGPEDAADLVAANIRSLGVKMADIRYILHSHEHLDHVGGIARLQQLTGATVIASAPAAKVFASGIPATDDPQSGLLKPFPPVTAQRIIADGGVVRLGDLVLTAVATPGHTDGAMSWQWESCDGNICRAMVYADSMTAVSRDGYRFTDHPDRVATFRQSIARVAGLRCEVLLTPHPSASAMRTRFAAGKTLLDPDGCRTYAAGLTKALDERLAKEAAK